MELDLWLKLRRGRRAGRAGLAGLCLCLTVGCVAPRDAARLERNVVYGRVGSKKLMLDLYFPRGFHTNPHPVVVNVHGGAWTIGTKWAGTSLLARSELLKRGYVFASISYRLAPRHKFPAPIEDAKCAVRYLRAHAAEYHLDPDRIAALGASAGGHIVGLVGTADASAGFDSSGGWTNESSSVRAVVDMFGVADVNEFAKDGSLFLAKKVFRAKSAEDEILKRASPLTYVSQDDPPFLLLHGRKDGLVALNQSARMKDALDRAGVPAEFIIVENAGHGFYARGGRPRPSREEIAKSVADFLDRKMPR
jgi:acetyl esterase/lipase